MDKHIKILGMLNVVLGTAALFTIPVWLVAAGGLRGISSAFNDSFMGTIVAALCLFNLILAVPVIIGGIFIQRYQEWARIVLIITSALNVLNFPFGFALGAYSLWALTTEESEPLFQDPPYPYNKRAKKRVQAGEGSLKAKNARIIPSPSE